MIDVPVLVKDALREGNKKKTYRFLCSEPYENTTETYIPQATLNSEDYETVIYTAGDYRFYNGTVGMGFTATFVKASGGTSYINVAKKPGATSTEYYFHLDEETTITITSFDGGSEIDIQSVITNTTSGYNYSFTIDNDTLVYESVKFDERTCSTENLKFGLCEGASLEFQYFDHVNINKYKIEAFIDVQYGQDQWHTIPMGFFYVDSCLRQASTGIHKITAYNKLKSEYLDAKANTLLDLDFVNPSIQLTLYDIQKTLLEDYQTGISEETQSTVSMANWLWTKGYTANFRTKTFASSTSTSSLNIRMMGGAYTSTASFTTIPFSNVWHWHLDETKDYVVKSEDNLDKSEDTIYAAISRAIQKSGITSPATQIGKLVKSLQYDYSTFDDQDPPSTFPKTLTGWVYIYSIILRKADGTYEWYSKTGYTNKRPGCYGSMQDLTHKILTGYTDMWFVRVGSFGKGNYSQQTWSTVWRISDQTSFEYYKAGGVVDTGVYAGQDFFTHMPEVDSITGLTAANMITVNPYNLPDFTLRDIINATYETVCQYGKLDRVTDLFSGMPLNNSRLYPADTLYPADSLYPNGNSERGDASAYSKLWTDSSRPDTFRNLIITYKGLDENNTERDFILTRQVNADGTQDYVMNNNWIFKTLTWNSTQVAEYADAMVELLRGVKWIPFEMWAAGLPYMETGDEIEIITPDGTFPSYILQRTLSGIQNLQDTYINGTLDIF